MAYITPITDRTVADIAAQNSRAYFNIADWIRIYSNLGYTSRLAAIISDQAVDPLYFYLNIPSPTITDFPIIENFNNLLLCLYDVSNYYRTHGIPSLPTIKHDWEAGSNKSSPSYTHVNQWESTIDTIWNYFNGNDLEICPTLSADLTITNGNREIVVDCISTGSFSIFTEGTGTLYII